MSYDLICYRERPGESPDESLGRLEELAGISAPPDDAAWAEIARVGDELAAVDSGAGIHRDSERGFVQVSTDRFQVSVYEHEAALTMPYWSDGSDDPWSAIAGYLDVLRRAGFTIYDPQAGGVVGGDIAADVSAGYRASAARALPVLEEMRAGLSSKQRRWPFGRRKKDA